MSRKCIATVEEQPHTDIGIRLEWGMHGSAEMASERIERFIDAVVRHFVFHVMPQANTANSPDILARDVIRQFK